MAFKIGFFCHKTHKKTVSMYVCVYVWKYMIKSSWSVSTLPLGISLTLPVFQTLKDRAAG